MDLKAMKSNADLDEEFKKWKAPYEQKIAAIKAEEINKVKQAFKDYFKNDTDFRISETANSVTAGYKDVEISLTEETDENRRNTSLSRRFTLNKGDKETYQIFTTVYSEPPQQNVYINQTPEQLKQRQIQYYRGVAEGTIIYSFKYGLNGKKGVEYDTLAELLDSI